MTDYAKMSGPELLAELGTDAAKWAAAFQQTVLDPDDIEIDEGLMICWFANVIMNTHDILTGNGPVVLPDGSTFVVGITNGG